MRTRSYGIEYRMDFGRSLWDMRQFLKTTGDDLDLRFADVCRALEISPDTARKRISISQTWDTIRSYIDQQGLSVRMPATEYHVEKLLPVEFEQRGQAWIQCYKHAIEQQTPITGDYIEAFVTNFKALPVETEAEEADEEEQEEISFDEPEEVVVTQADIPPGTKEAPGATVTASSPPLTQTPGEGPVFKHPPEVLEAIEKIVGICAGTDKENEENWRRILSDPVKIKFEGILDWAKEDPETILKIARLIHGDFNTGLRQAIRIVKRVIDGRTTLSHLENYCLASGGRWEHEDGEFRILITKLRTL